MVNRLTKSRPLTENESMNLSLTELYIRLQAYEDAGLEPEEIRELLHDSTGPLHKKLGEWIDAEQEGRLVVLPCGDDVTPIKCTGLKCPMQAGKVDPATCKAADTCKWATKPLTNADKIRSMTDEELAYFIAKQRFSVVNQIADKLGIDVTMEFIAGQKNALNWLKQEVSE